MYLNEHGIHTLGPGGGNGGEISGYRTEKWFFSMREYTQDVAREGQQGGGVTATLAPQLPHLQHVARSQQIHRASAQETPFRSVIARQLSEIDWCYSGWCTCKEGKEEGNNDRIEELRREDEEQAVG